MKKTHHIPFRVHLVCLSITFFGWFGLSYFFGKRESLADSIIGAVIFTVIMAALDAFIWYTAKMGEE